MEGFKGTRGPWVASKTDRSIGPISKDDDQSYGMILPVAWVEFNGKPEHQVADANLIAAAPELLEALQKIKDVMDSFRYLADKVGMNDADGFYLGHTQGLSEKAEAAIKKALGQ